MALILDTGPLYASLDRDDAKYAISRELIERSVEDLIIPAPVLVEVDWLIQRRMEPTVFGRLLNDIAAGFFRVVNLDESDYTRVRELLIRYADSDIGFVDAAVLAIVERLNEPKLATLDHRHFRMLRPRHVPALQLLP